MPENRMPSVGSREFSDYVAALHVLDHDAFGEFAKEKGYANGSSLLTQLEKRGFYRSHPFPIPAKQQPEPIIVSPKVQLQKYRPPRTRKGDPETQVILASDGHAGEITPSFNPDVYQQRMKNLFNGMLEITKLHRDIYPINELVVLNAGDNIHGENPYQGGKVETIAMGARNQVLQLALPAWIDFILSARQEFKVVAFHGVRGNHGRYDRLAPATSNWDSMLYDGLQSAVGNKRYDGVTIESSEEFYKIIEVQGHRFFLFHGDQVRSTQGIPLFALKRRLDAWYIQFSGFDYACCGHFHKYVNDQMTSRYRLLMSASLVSDDTWSLERLGISSVPSQWTFGVHRGRGMTWRYALDVEATR